LAGQLERTRPAHAAELQRQRRLSRACCREQPGVRVELTVEVDRSVREEARHDLVRLAQPLDRTLRLLDWNPILLEQREVARAEHELCTATSQLVERRSLLRDERRVLQDDARDLGTQPDP